MPCLVQSRHSRHQDEGRAVHSAPGKKAAVLLACWLAALCMCMFVFFFFFFFFFNVHMYILVYVCKIMFDLFQS